MEKIRETFIDNQAKVQYIKERRNTVETDGEKMKGKKLIAYCLTENLQMMREKDIEMLDSIHIAFGLISDGEVYWKEEHGLADMARIRAVHPGIRLVLSVGGWGADGFSQAAETEEGRKKWAGSVLRLVERYDFDGIDVDWEYPGSDKAGIRAVPKDRENFTLLLQETRRQLSVLKPYKTLSIAAGALKSYLEHTDMERVTPFLDYVQLMTYDLCGEWEPVTGHHAGLFPYGEGTPNSDELIRLFVKAGVPYEKLVMGAAFYSREWQGVKEAGPLKPASGAGKIRSYDEIAESLKKGEGNYIKFWDDRAKAAYLYNGSSYVSYEDGRALQYKAKYVREHEMYGMMYWEYGQDRTYRLTGFLREQLDNRF